ncbi:MAG: type II toxin-antitoxin system HicB family antitoxin [Candidatus Scalindua sediminis]|jgi:predicted RNase H-like HicB family nuclease|nr:type II toxin-antitoxin system HicB family antitoxin [Candidatus Scalindua sediminis]
MIRQYIEKAMGKAKYEILSDDGSFYGEIPVCRGVCANAKSLEKCRKELEETLEEWILFRIHKNLSIPVVDKIELKIKETLVT